jgi:hypothetical protein
LHELLFVLILAVPHVDGAIKARVWQYKVKLVLLIGQKKIQFYFSLFVFLVVPTLIAMASFGMKNILGSNVKIFARLRIVFDTLMCIMSPEQREKEEEADSFLEKLLFKTFSFFKSSNNGRVLAISLHEVKHERLTPNLRVWWVQTVLHQIVITTS